MYVRKYIHQAVHQSALDVVTGEVLVDQMVEAKEWFIFPWGKKIKSKILIVKNEKYTGRPTNQQWNTALAHFKA